DPDNLAQLVGGVPYRLSPPSPAACVVSFPGCDPARRFRHRRRAGFSGRDHGITAGLAPGEMARSVSSTAHHGPPVADRTPGDPDMAPPGVPPLIASRPSGKAPGVEKSPRSPP